MSRVIKNDHRWTDDEVTYQLSRGRHKEVEQNRKDFPEGSKPAESKGDSVELELSTEVYEFVQNLDEKGLLDELKKRELSIEGGEVDLKVRLAQAMQKEVDARNDGSN